MQLPEHIFRCIRALEENPGCNAVVCGVVKICGGLCWDLIPAGIEIRAVGDGKSDIQDDKTLFAPRVMLCAAHQANAVLRIIAGEFEV